MSTNIKVAFFDIDGTLASNSIDSPNIEDRIPKSTKLAIQKLKENGITPMIATGRGRMAIVDVAQALDMDSYISANGLSVTYHKEEVYKDVLTIEQISSVLEDIKKLEDISIMLETTTGNVIIQVTDAMKERIGKHGDFVGYDIEKMKAYDTYEVTVMGDNLKERVNLSSETLQAKMVGPGTMNIFHKHASKATGIEKVLEIFSLDKSQAIVFGDEENDMEMFKAVENAVAMGNAVEELKAVASYVTDDVDNNGIYKACVHFNLI